MKTHQPIIVITLSCLLLLVSACGKKSIRGVSGGEDLISSEVNHEGTDHDEDLYGDSSVPFEESLVADGNDSETVEALSAADLNDGQGKIAIVGGRPEGASSIFPASTRSGIAGSSGAALGVGTGNGMGGMLNRDTLAASGPSSETSAAQGSARRTGARTLRDVYFAYDSWRLSEQSHRILEANAEWLKAHPHARLTIEGHCDERGTQAYNYVLGERRAETAKQYLSHLGVPPYQMMVVSYGKDRPVCHVFSAPCFRSNRRAHFSIDVNTASHE
ncbi:MAG: OmpA family protein [Nitrospira sp.]|nr:OmpA family protein [Nitrospira sp.]